MRILLITPLLFAATAMAGPAIPDGSSPDPLASAFQNPGPEATPRAYWNWLNGAVRPADLTLDLEAARSMGLAGMEIWDCEAMQNPDGFVPAGPPFLGPESVAAIRHTLTEAARLGLELGLVASSGWNAGGPWVPPEHASKNLFHSEVMIEGPGPHDLAFPDPDFPAECPRGADGRPLWSLELAVLAWPDHPDRQITDPKTILDLSKHFKDGRLTWSAPPGKWRAVRFVCSNNGQQLIAASPNSKGPFIDFLDPASTRFHFEYILDKLGIAKGTDPHPLKYLELDSMELHPGIQWTTGFRDWFVRNHGYDPVPWLPVLLDWTIGSPALSGRFLYDYKKAVSDLLIFSHYTTGSRVCAEYGLGLAAEAGGPGPPIWDTCPVDSLKALGNVDVPRGEFWLASPNNIFLIKEIASAAHIYGKPIVDAESWTTWQRWRDGPFERKMLVDWAFCEGLNRVTYHCFAHSPESAGSPGRAYHAGIDMNPRVVWWPMARPFMDYLGRCCHLLQQGLFVADVACFYGDQAPNFWPMHHNVPSKPLLPGLDPGYDYDVVNSDVILNRMAVRDGRLVLPDGMSYRVLVLPDQDHMPIEVIEKLRQLAKDGATIIGRRPSTVPGLHLHEDRTARLQEIASELWGPEPNPPAGRRSVGMGAVCWGITPGQWLAEAGIAPDFQGVDPMARQHLDYIHRRTPEADIYFVRNLSELPVRTQVAFRVVGRSPYYWDPSDGSMRPALVFHVADSTTTLPLELEPGASIFVIFRGSAPGIHATSLRATTTVADPTLPAPVVASITGQDVTLQCWQNGAWEMMLSNKSNCKFETGRLPSPILVGGDWEVAFDPEWGAPARLTFPRLISWSDHPDHGVRHYSGPGTYRQTIDIPEAWIADGRGSHLDLGDVREVASVKINGTLAGIVWKPPYRLDITSLIKPGPNDVEIEVRNLWVNRLAGDQDLPVNQRLTRSNITSDGSRSLAGPWKPQAAGLLGPVRLLPSMHVQEQAEAR